MHFHLAGLRAVVTDGTSGLGAAIVRTLAAQGCQVDFCALDRASAEAVLASARGLPGKARARLIDAADTLLLQDWMADLEGFDILVPNIRVVSSDPRRALEVDIRATVNATESAIPLLRRSRHPVITYVGAPMSPGISSAAMAHYMKALTARLQPAVRINTVSPGDAPDDSHEEMARVVAFVSGPAAWWIFDARRKTPAAAAGLAHA
ncbi:MAG: SDR family oxidoreductase [Comamonadaceae bacterium]|nr:MAG: SDR family oxidoreductase [Comamonadaceae bacterium]